MQFERTSGSIYRICALIIIFIETVYAQYSFVQPRAETTIGYPIQVHDKGRPQVVQNCRLYSILYLPQFKDCTEVSFKIKLEGHDDKPRDIDCLTYGMSRYYIWNKFFKTITHVYCYGTDKSKPALVVLYRSAYRTCPEPAWHYVAGTGPGWVDLRYAQQHHRPNCMMGMRLVRWRHVKNQNPGRIFDASSMAEFDYSDPTLRAKPEVRCPQWKTYDIFCQVVTASIYPIHNRVKNFTDYWFAMIQMAKWPHPITHQPQVEVPDTESPPRLFMVRVWDDCDTTMDRCPKVLRSIPFHKEWIVEPTERGVWDVPTRLIGLKNKFPLLENTTQWEYGADAWRTPALLTMRALWPLFLVFCLFMLIIVLPLIYFASRRRTRDNDIRSWYGWTSNDGRISFAMAVPTNTAHVMRQPHGEQEQEFAAAAR